MSMKDSILTALRSRKLLIPVVAAFLAAMLPNACTQPTPTIPHSLAEYSEMRRTNPTAFPTKTLRMKNLQRVLDSELPTQRRVDSLNLLLHLGAEDPEVTGRLSQVLSQADCPYEIHDAVLSHLMSQNHPGIAAYVVPALAQSNQNPQFRDSILDWLMRNPSPDVLGQVVRFWAEEPAPTGPNEPRYRHIAERITGRKWDEALLAGINSRRSFPRGRALEILACDRVPKATLKRRILQIHPETEAMAALQSFIEAFDYLPANRAQFATLVTVFKTRLETISEVSRLAGQWRNDYGYTFSIGDFHLLSRLSRDPLRNMLRREQLVLEITRSLGMRRHIPWSAISAGPERAYTDQFCLQVHSLTLSDLWNLHLLNEMLNRPRMQLALRILADKVRSDPTSAASGLVFYQHGQAEAVLYPPPESGEGTAGLQPVSREMVAVGRDSLCRFYTHFDKTENSHNAGPNADELDDAARGGYYGLILTSVSQEAFCAHYYSPDGKIVSIGRLPFGR